MRVWDVCTLISSTSTRCTTSTGQDTVGGNLAGDAGTVGTARVSDSQAAVTSRDGRLCEPSKPHSAATLGLVSGAGFLQPLLVPTLSLVQSPPVSEYGLSDSVEPTSGLLWRGALHKAVGRSSCSPRDAEKAIGRKPPRCFLEARMRAIVPSWERTWQHGNWRALVGKREVVVANSIIGPRNDGVTRWNAASRIFPQHTGSFDEDTPRPRRTGNPARL